MSKQLENKNIVIIGGTTGIGLSAAKAFIAEGAKVVVVGRNADSVSEAKKVLGKTQKRLLLMPHIRKQQATPFLHVLTSSEALMAYIM